MKAAFHLGTQVRTVGTPHVYGELVEGPRHSFLPPRPYPHYAGEGFYFVKWEERPEIYVSSEEDIELAPPKGRR